LKPVYAVSVKPVTPLSFPRPSARLVVTVAVHALVRDGKLIRILTFLSWPEALEALGLAE